MPCLLCNCLFQQSALQASEGHLLRKCEDGQVGGTETLVPLPLRGWHLLAALLPLDSFTFSSLFYGAEGDYTFLGYRLSKAHSLIFLE